MNKNNIVVAVLFGVLAGLLFLCGMAALAGTNVNTGATQIDANGAALQIAPRAVLQDNWASKATITNLVLTSNVVTVTATHNYTAGQVVTVNLLTGPTL